MQKTILGAVLIVGLGFAVQAQDEKTQPRFVNAAEEFGLAQAAPGRIYLHDLNDDGYPDLIAQVPDSGKGPGNKGGVAQIYMNREGKDGGREFVLDEDLTLGHNGKFADDIRHASVFTIVGDVDNDNEPDLLRPAFQEAKDHKDFPDTGERAGIWLGDIKKGDVKFKQEPGNWAATEAHATCAAAFVDYDRDGNLDVFLGGWYVSYGVTYEGHVNRLYKGDGKGAFTDVTEQAGLLTAKAHGEANSSRPTYGVSVCDYNGDGWQDLVVANYGRQWNRLWHNNGDGTFKDVAPELGVDGDEIRHGKHPSWAGRADEPPFRANGNTFSIAPADFDNDGDIDLFCSEITHGWAGDSSDLSALLVNNGEEGGFKFTRLVEPFIRERADKNNWNQGDLMALWGDLDHDGLLDLVLASSAYPDNQRLRVFRQTPAHSFEDVTLGWGIDWDICGHIAMDDLDGDGDLDIVGMGDKRHSKMHEGSVIGVWRNDGAEGNWMRITLEGNKSKGSNRFAYGAKVWVTVGETTMLREVQSGAGHQGVAPSRTLHFGLGDAKEAHIRIEWPDKKLTVTEYKGVKPNRHLRIHQTKGIED
ncbi:MAG: CRTAC1 family protein [Planctomycetes bacterium]|nr:CRTAC1 family protein [Planctomycetota bacterium]